MSYNDARPSPTAPGAGCTCLVVVIAAVILAFTFFILSISLEGNRDDEGAGVARPAIVAGYEVDHFASALEEDPLATS